ncbi:MAG: protein translocase subunit SecF [Pseudomonadota bacterium]
MHLMKDRLSIDFMGKRHLAIGISLLLMAISIGSLAVRGLNFGIDFTGGTLIEVGYQSPADLGAIRSALADNGYEQVQVQYFGTTRDVLIRIPPTNEKGNVKLSDDILAVLSKSDADVMMRRVEFVGPQVGKELTEQGGLAMIYALIGILIYIMVRFHYRFAPGAVAALVHDVVIVMGVFSFWQIGFDLTVLAALLAVIGYSLNDTIVVFDRIRETFRKMRKGTPLEIINMSINQTLSRTLMTSLTTLVVLVMLFIFGGEVIHSFALALILGVMVGTYSSIFIASTTALALGISKQDLMQVSKEEGSRDSTP